MENGSKDDLPVIGITIGDLNGIGTEVIIKSLIDNRITKQFTPVIYGSTKTLSFYRKALKVDNFNYIHVKNEKEFIPKKINVLNVWDHPVDITMGKSTPEGGEYAFKALEKAVSDAKEGHIDAIVTAPINKHNIQQEDFNFPGHTEYLADRCSVKNELMFLVSDELRVAVMTGHIPLKDVSSKLSKESIIKKLEVMINSLKHDFGIKKPRIAVLGLNPHAGEMGLLGDEEEKIINPAVIELKNKGNLVFGPFAADGFFGTASFKKFDAVLAMYHDQGLIPFKSIAFDTGVNFTAGLPIVRTSPDHGTAYDIAGKDEANPSSMIQAIFAAIDIVKNRKEYKTFEAAPLNEENDLKE
ncbi:4-hydroxythreonine-4-phosphate dehydrogenase PdxA [Marinigracilibium pacificum]|uniref:4-hydroxythreonine-4-phosphate dehydrogenase PdxA n=1 Tax=Marinigracilibium pacificum TaxID=2729599 RepID=A0A848J662_9BACT|nr:4-hydroxythreonine-4-phosphate dehydrogenase PdxA [Marinigracilibium pacificum]NMM50728.1 4-hydroxythreonine-4-phosphate dehydrogenase PdxA [Marinigracilibium pacificum]